MTDARGQISEPAPIAPAGLPAGATVCTACPLLCDDVVVRPAERRFERLCDRGAEAFRHHHESREATGPMATIDGRPADPVAALAAAATRLAGARCVLVTGLGHLAIEGVTSACDVAEALGAAIAPAADDGPPAGGSTIARWGEITAAWEELRDRADLVIFWGLDPAVSHPRFVERFVTPPLPSSLPRRTIAVGPSPLRLPPTSDHVHLPLDAVDDDIDLARLVLASLLGRPVGSPPARLRDATIALRSAIDAARCVGIVSGRHDPLGLSRWGVIGVVRELSRRLPAFEVPLDSVTQAPNAAGATAMLTWRYGAAASAARAGRGDAVGSPQAAIDLVSTGAVDTILALGRLPAALEEAIRGRIDPRGVIRITPATPDVDPAGVWLRCRELSDQPGTLLRADGRTIVLTGSPAEATPSPVALLAAIRERLASPTPTKPEGATA